MRSLETYLQPSSPRQAATPLHRIFYFFCAFAACFDDILRNNSTTASLCTQRRHKSVVASAQTRLATSRWRMPCSNLGRLTADWHCTVEIAGAPDSTEQLAYQFPVGPWMQATRFLSTFRLLGLIASNAVDNFTVATVKCLQHNSSGRPPCIRHALHT